MPNQPLDLIGGFYQDESLPWSAQDTVNWIPEAAEAQGTRTPTLLRQAPGLRPYVQVGEGPIRGMRNVEGKLLVVSGNTLYQISNSLIAIPRGTIPGTGLVSITHNQRGSTNQVLIVNGAAGYVYDTSALTLTKITDPGYPGAFVADFIDGYLAQVEPLRRFWFHSGLRDALEYNTLDRYEAEGQPDPIVSLIVDHREVWVFGERTIEPYVNVGTLTNTFQRASNTVIESGCSAKFSPAKIDNSIFWLDELGIVRRAQGYTAVRISTGPIERAIADLNWSRAFGFTVTDRGHAIYYLTFPDGLTFGYDLTTGLWHRRESYGLNRWRVNGAVQWQGQWVAGDYRQGLLYAMDWDYPFDGVDPMIRERRTGVLHSNQDSVLVPYAELVIDNGRGPVEVVQAPGQPEGPTIAGNAPNGEIGEAYTFSYTLDDGTPPYVVSLRSGALPPGLTLSVAGVLSGTPTEVGAYSWVVRVTDTNGLFDDHADGASVNYIVEYWDSTPGKFNIENDAEFQSDDRAIFAVYIDGLSKIRAQSVEPLTGKRYFEFDLEENNNNTAGRFYIGFHNQQQSIWPGAPVNAVYLYPQEGDGAARIAFPIGNTFLTPNLGWSNTSFGTVRVRAAINVADRRCWFGNAAGWFTGDPDAGTGGHQLQAADPPIYLYGDLDNITAAKERRIEIVLPDDWTWTPPAGFS